MLLIYSLFSIFALHPQNSLIILALVLCLVVFHRSSSVWQACSAFQGLVLVWKFFLFFFFCYLLWASFFCYVYTTANDFLCMAGIFLSRNSLDLYPMVPLTLVLSEAICLPLHYLCCLLLGSQTLITFFGKIKWLEFKPNCPQFSTENKCIIHACDRRNKQSNKDQSFTLI